MRVYCGDPREAGFERGARMRGFPPQQRPGGSGEGGAVGWGYPEWVEPGGADPGERGPEGGEAKGGGVDIK